MLKIPLRSWPGVVLMGIVILFGGRLTTAAVTTITVETTNENHQPREYNCEKVLFQPESYVTCICLNGVWAFEVKRVSGGTRWKVLGSNKQKCYHINEWIGEIRRVSNFPHQSMLHQFKGTEETFWVFNIQDWEAEIDEDVDNNRICLPGAPKGQYCIYHLGRLRNITHTALQRKDFKRDCSSTTKEITEEGCKNLAEYEAEDETPKQLQTSCILIPPASRNSLTRFKRAPPDAGTDATGTDGADKLQPSNATISPEDEDYKPKTEQNIIVASKGDPLIMRSIIDWSKAEVSNRIKFDDQASLRKERKSKAIKKTPAVTLLQYCSDVSAQLCGEVPESTFKIAFQAFLVQQLQKLHLKEPYIPFPAFSRALDAMEMCRARAKKFIFETGTSRSDNNNETSCGNEVTKAKGTSDTLMQNGVPINLPELPDYAKTNPEGHEPLVELVWKSFLIGHSYCFPYFSQHFNDHHQFTVTLIKFFSNAIQNMWFLRDGSGNVTSSDAPGLDAQVNGTANATNNAAGAGAQWYGGYLGDTNLIFKDIDNCYRAARLRPVHNPNHYFPWYLQRPAQDPENEWFNLDSATTESARSKRSFGFNQPSTAPKFPPGQCYKKKIYRNPNYIDFSY